MASFSYDLLPRLELTRASIEPLEALVPGFITFEQMPSSSSPLQGGDRVMIHFQHEHRLKNTLSLLQKGYVADNLQIPPSRHYLDDLLLSLLNVYYLAS